MRRFRSPVRAIIVLRHLADHGALNLSELAAGPCRIRPRAALYLLQRFLSLHWITAQNLRPHHPLPTLEAQILIG